MRGSSGAFALLLVPVLAGCLQQPLETIEPADAEDLLELLPIPAFPIEQDHDHTDVLLHRESANIASIGFNSGYGDGGTSSYPTPSQGYSEIFARGTLVFLGRRDPLGDGMHQDGGFIIFDVKDPTKPQKLSEWPGLAAYDVESTEDNKFAFFASQYLNRQQNSSIPPNDPGEIPRTIDVIDISDPTKPRLAFAVPIPTRGAHTFTYHKTDNLRELLLVQTYDFIPDPSLDPPAQAPNLGHNPASQRVLIFEFKREPLPSLVLLSTFEKYALPDGSLPAIKFNYMPHDTAVQKHPKTGQLIMYVAYWDLGAILVDISDPGKPKEISVLSDFSPSKLKAIHLAAPSPDLIRGRHVTITEPEIGPAGETGQYTLFDTTNPAKPTRLGYWTLPGELINPSKDASNPTELRFSPHNFDVDHGKIYIAHYHAGVWVVDISSVELLEAPKAVAFFQPNVARPGYKGDVPLIWSAVYHQGYIFASDKATGLHVLQYKGDEGMGAEGGMGHGHVCAGATEQRLC